MTREISSVRQLSVERLAAGVIMAGFQGDPLPNSVRELCNRGLGSFILFAHNVGDADAIRSLTQCLQDAADGRALIAIDHEGGRVMRLRQAATAWTSAMAWGATGDLLLAERASLVAAQELASLGINVNFAPVADVLGDFRNPVLSTRCFSDNPETVGNFVAAFVRGHRAGSVASTAKHFPGHGYTPVDSHLDLPRVDRSQAELHGADLIPFRAAIAAGVDCIMVSHVWYTHLDPRPTPASTSTGVLRLARESLEYEGVVVSDCMEMGAVQRRMTTGQAVVSAIAAGVDLAIVSHRAEAQQEAIEALIDAAHAGSLPVARLQEANRRLDCLRDRVLRARPSVAQGGSALASEIARRAVTLVRDRENFLPLSGGRIGVLSFASGPTTQVEEGKPNTALAEFGRQHADVIEADARAAPETVLQQLGGASNVLVGTVRAYADPKQTEVIDTLLCAGKHVIVIGLRDPFDLLAFPKAPCFLAAYGDGQLELESAMAVIFGKATPTGRLPVEIPGLYPRGHGLVAHGP